MQPKTSQGYQGSSNRAWSLNQRRLLEHANALAGIPSPTLLGLSDLHDSLKSGQVLLDLPLRIVLEDLRDIDAGHIGGRIVAQHNSNPSCSAGFLGEVNRAYAVDARALERLPGDYLVLDVPDDPGLPGNDHPGWSL